MEESHSRAETRRRQSRRGVSPGSAALISLPELLLSSYRALPTRLLALAIAVLALLLTLPERASSFPLVARDTPNDRGGSVTLKWAAPTAPPASWLVVRRERGGTFAPMDTLEGDATGYIDRDATNGVAYEYRLIAQPLDPGLDSEISAAAQAAANWFDRPKLNVLIVVGSFFLLLFIYIRRSESGVQWKFRTIPGLAAIEEAVGRATEMGKSVLYVPGVQDIDDIQTIASMILLGRVARMSAKYETDLMVPTNSPGVFTVAEEVVKSGYADVGRSDAYKSDQVRYITTEQFAYVAAVNGLMLREKPAANLLLGAFFAESLLLAETGHAVGAIQIAGTANVHQMPFFVVACDYTLIGEEYYAASALLSNDARLLGSLKASDTVKILLIVVLVVGCVLMTFGHTWLGEFFATQ
jgi:hypothetical protein